MNPILYTLLFLLGFYLLYVTSERADVPASQLKNWARSRQSLFKFTGLALIVIALVYFMFYYGIGAGFFIAITLLMSIASLIILLVPLRKVIK